MNKKQLILSILMLNAINMISASGPNGFLPKKNGKESLAFQIHQKNNLSCANQDDGYSSDKELNELFKPSYDDHIDRIEASLEEIDFNFTSPPPLVAKSPALQTETPTSVTASHTPIVPLLDFTNPKK